MKFKRERKPSPWFVHDIYLRDTWGIPFYVSRSPRSKRRQFFIILLVLFGIVDAALAVFLGIAYLFPQRSVSTAVKVNSTLTAQARQQPTRIARRTTLTPAPTRRLPTPTRRATRAITVAPPPPTSNPTPVPPTAVATPARTVSFTLPAGLNLAALRLVIPYEPTECTPADVMPDVVDHTVKLCGGQTYRPFTLRGDTIGVFGDRSAVIRSQGRGYGIVAEGTRLYIQNVVIRATTDNQDLNILLCLYPDCSFHNGSTSNQGGVSYGGGILVRASETTIRDSDIAGGVAGIAAEHVSGLKLLNNRLDNNSGWGAYNFAVESSYFIGNSLSRNNRACNTEGGYLPTGCESAGWLCIACQQNVIAKNLCVDSGDCFYMNGEGNLTSNHNRFYQNECRASPHNCYEVTFATGNEFVENIARDDPETGAACKYPFWIGGSQVIFARNQWSCEISPETALADATASTLAPTNIENR